MKASDFKYKGHRNSYTDILEKYAKPGKWPVTTPDHGGSFGWPGINLLRRKRATIHAKQLSDWQFFTSNDKMQVADFDQPFNGLHLPKKVVDQIYRINAQKWYP